MKFAAWGLTPGRKVPGSQIKIFFLASPQHNTLDKQDTCPGIVVRNNLISLNYIGTRGL